MKTNYGKILIWAAIAVAVPRWAGAFIAADVDQIPESVSVVLHYANLFAGVGMGFLEVIAAAYLLDAWGRMKPKRTWNAKHYDHQWIVLTVFVIGLFVFMPFILAPYVVSRMNGTTIAAALANNAFFQYGWAIAVVMSPAFIVGGVAVANDNLMGNAAKTAVPANKSNQRIKPQSRPKPEPEPEQPRVPVPKPAAATEQSARSILAEQPTISGSALGRELGVSESMGRRLRRELLPEMNLNGDIK